MEYIEYKQTGMIKVKETPLSVGELKSIKSRRYVDYYDFAYSQRNRWFDGLDLFF